MNIFGINGGELIVLIVLALLLLGPDKIPEYLRKLREWIHQARKLAEGAKEQFKEETGTDFDEVDWQKYDPRQYDPRRVIREALSEPIEDLEASLTDAKDTVQEAADTVVEKPAERPRLTHAEIMAAAVPIDQLDQQPHLPDPSHPNLTNPTNSPKTVESSDAEPTARAPAIAEEVTSEATLSYTAPAAVAPTAQDPVDVTPPGTPFDAEAT